MNPNTKKLDGKVAVVTGASKGIGAGIAKHLAAEGAVSCLSGFRLDYWRIAGDCGRASLRRRLTGLLEPVSEGTVAMGYDRRRSKLPRKDVVGQRTCTTNR